MKILPVGLLILCAAVAWAAVSLEDIVKLSKAGTRDDVILQLIQKEGLGKPVTSKEIVYLKQQGVSDRVIQYLIKLSSNSDATILSDKNLRSYYTTNKKGQRIRVITNLDEDGKRMGGPIPPDPAPEPIETAYHPAPAPQEIRVIVENNDSRYRRQNYEEEYVDPKYEMPPFPDYSYYPYSVPYYPYYPIIPKFHHKNRHHFPKDPNQPHWRMDYSKNLPLVQPRQRTIGPSIPGSKPAGTMRSFKRN